MIHSMANTIAYIGEKIINYIEQIRSMTFYLLQKRSHPIKKNH